MVLGAKFLLRDGDATAPTVRVALAGVVLVIGLPLPMELNAPASNVFT